MTEQFRIEKDSLGELRVPAAAHYGAQTQRAVENFAISGQPMPAAFLRALGLIKSACAAVNAELDLLPGAVATAIQEVADEIAAGEHLDQFPVDRFQTGSGTSTNMNANEVIARLAGARSALEIHPNDHVNCGQSSNDVIPATIHLSAALQIEKRLSPALASLIATIERRARESADIVKTGRTHLMDAMPLRLDQELGAWAAQIRHASQGIQALMPALQRLALGATAVGTGVNAHPQAGARVAARLAQRTGLAFSPSDNYFAALATQDAAVAMSGQLKTLAVTLMKISNDLRWMNSGPLAGLGEISLPALQPGSSIMPGKVNPVIPEAVAMVCAQVMGNDVAIAVGGQSGNFQLNVMLPLIASNLLHSIELLAAAVTALDEKAIAGFQVQRENIEAPLRRNPVLVTALNRVIGYERGAEIAKRAYAEARPVLEVALEMTDLDRPTLERLLDPAGLTAPEA